MDDLEKTFVLLVMVVFGIALFVGLKAEISALDTSAWTFMGHATIASLIGVMPELFLFCFILIPVIYIVKEHV